MAFVFHSQISSGVWGIFEQLESCIEVDLNFSKTELLRYRYQAENPEVPGSRLSLVCGTPARSPGCDRALSLSL